MTDKTPNKSSFAKKLAEEWKKKQQADAAKAHEFQQEWLNEPWTVQDQMYGNKVWVKQDGQFTQVPPTDKAFRDYMDDLRTKMYNGMGVPNTLFEGGYTNFTSGKSDQIKYDDVVDMLNKMKGSSYSGQKSGKTAYQKGYEQVFGDPFATTRPAYQGPVVKHDGKKSPYQQKKEDEARQKVYKEAQSKTTLRFVYVRNRYTGDLRLDHVRKVQKGMMT